MAWLRYDDTFTERPSWDGVSFEARWHYIALIELCGRQERLDGRIPHGVAQRASDVPHPDACQTELSTAGWLKVDDEGVTMLFVDEHVPPPSVRLNAQQSKERMRRMRERKRLHAQGDHSLCEPDCVTSSVTRNSGSGRVGSGELLTEGSKNDANGRRNAVVGAP